MITIDAARIAERAVYEGITAGLAQIQNNPELAKQPQALPQLLTYAVLHSMSEVFDFGVQAVKYTESFKADLWAAQQQREEAATNIEALPEKE